MAIARQRDLEDVRRGLAAWLGAPVDGISRPAAGGLSTETYLFSGNGAELVARMAPAGDALFPAYDLAAQAFVMETLAEHRVVPVPRVVAYVDDESYVGAPFVVMARVVGRVPTDQPSYLAEGWVHDATPEEQCRLQDAFADVCGRIHTCDWDGMGLAFLARPGGTGLDAEIAWWARYLDWAADGAPVAPVRDALAWCRERAPQNVPPPSLLWGDVRIPNVVFDADSVPAAVLDWEMASIGPAEIDLGWFCAVHRTSVAFLGADLPGFRPLDELLRDHERRIGRELAPMQWYEAWGAFRSAAIMVRLGRLLYDLGLVADLAMQERNPTTKLLRTLMA